MGSNVGRDVDDGLGCMRGFIRWLPVCLALWLLAIVLCRSAIGSDLSPLLQAIRQVESSGRELPPYHDVSGMAIGPYGIHADYAKDAGRNWRACQREAYARDTVRMYWMRYEPNALKRGDSETLARCHNSGCGWRRHPRASDGYWNKVRAQMKGYKQ